MDDDHFNRGKEYFRDKKYEEAIIELKLCIKNNPSNAEAYYGLGASYFKTGRKEQAIKYLKRARSLGWNRKWVKNVELMLKELGEVELSENDALTENEERKYEEGSRKQYGGVKPLTKDYREAFLHLENGRYEKAAQAFERLLKQNGTDARAMAGLAVAFIFLGREEEGLKKAKFALKLDEQDPEVRGLYGLALVNAGRIAKGTEEIKRAIEDFPDWIRLHKFLAQAFLKDGKKERAAGEIEKYMEQEKKDPDAYRLLALAKFEPSDPSASFGAINKALTVVGRSPEMINLRGILNLQLGKIDEAMKDFEEAIKLDNTFFEAYASIGIAKFEKKDFEGAEEAFRKALDSGSVREDIYEKLAFLYLERKESAKAGELADELIRRNPDSTVGHCIKGLVLKLQGKPEEAVKNLEKAAAGKSPGPVIYFNLGKAYGELKDFSRAALCFASSLLLTGDDAETYYLLGLCMRQIGESRKARSCFEKVKQIAPESEFARQAGEQLKALEN